MFLVGSAIWGGGQGGRPLPLPPPYLPPPAPSSPSSLFLLSPPSLFPSPLPPPAPSYPSSLPFFSLLPPPLLPPPSYPVRPLFYEWNKHCEWSFTLGILVKIARSHRWLLCRDVDKETTQTSWIGTDQEVDCSVGNDANYVGEYMECKFLYFDPPPSHKLLQNCISFIASIGQFRPKKCVFTVRQP